MKLTLAQINPIIGDFHGNIDKVRNAISLAVSQGSEIICFPEMTITGYPPRDLLERSDFIAHTGSALEELIHFSENVDLAVIIGTVRPAPGTIGNRLHNSAVVLYRGRIIFEQAKSLLPTYDVFDEARYFDPADSHEIFTWKNQKIGLTICEDAWNEMELQFTRKYPEDPVKSLIQKGAGLIINLSASPFHSGKESLRYKLIHAHSSKNKVPFIMVNQTGGQDELIFDGQSMVFNEMGELICLLPAFRESVMTIDLSKPDRKRIRFPQLGAEECVYSALVLGLGDYLRKSQIRKTVIGLSGGIDSALVAAIASEAAGAENVMGVSMPSMYSSESSIRDAEKLAYNLGISFQIIPITALYDSYMIALKNCFSGTRPDKTEENIQARIRGNILMAISNKFRALTLATGNKSELSVGYCTMYGDMSGGLSVIGDVPKTLVYRLARYVNREKEIIPENSLTKPPSAELKPDQKDQDTLPPYEILDDIIDLYVDQMKSYEEILKNHKNPDMVRWVIQAISGSEFKRRQAAPALKITPKAYGTGRRMPIAAQYLFSWSPFHPKDSR